MNYLRHRLEAAALKFLGCLLRLLPRRTSLRIGEGIGYLVHLIGVRKRVAQQNLSCAYPHLPAPDLNRIAMDCYRHFGAVMVEFARLPLLSTENVSDLVEIAGLDILDDILKQGKGGIVVSGHLGNWELMGSSASVLGYPVSYVVTGQTNERVEALMDELRLATGVQIIKRHDAIKGTLKALRDNRLVAILSDQDAHEAGAFVPFFGRLASTPRGVATFSLRTGAPIVFAESHRQGTDKLRVRYKLVSNEHLPADREEATVELTRRFTARLEEAIRRHPEQWFWMHRRWKTPPP